MDENVDRLFQMLDHEAPDVRAQGHEILDCLDASARWQLALRLISPDRRAWRKAANYLLPHAIAAPRLTRFAVRCAEYRLMNERCEGREPADWAWRAIEAAERRAHGQLPKRTYDRILSESAHRRHNEHDYWDNGYTEILYESEIDMEQIPAGWPARSTEVGASLDPTPLLRSSGLEGLCDTLLSEESTMEVERTAAGSLIEPYSDEWGEVFDNIPDAATLDEYRVQRRLWLTIVFRGEDGLDELVGVLH